MWAKRIQFALLFSVLVVSSTKACFWSNRSIWIDLIIIKAIRMAESISDMKLHDNQYSDDRSQPCGHGNNSGRFFVFIVSWKIISWKTISYGMIIFAIFAHYHITLWFSYHFARKSSILNNFEQNFQLFN